MVTLEEVQKQKLESGEVNDLPPNLPLPKDRYCGRIKEGSFAPAKKSGNNQITFKCEVYHPATIKHPADKREYNIAGKEFTIYKPTSGPGLEHTLMFMKDLGLSPQLDTDNPDLEQFKGRTFSIILKSRDMTARKDLTPEEIAAGKQRWEAEPIKDEEGRPSLTYGIEVDGFGDIRATKIAAPANPY